MRARPVNSTAPVAVSSNGQASKPEPESQACPHYQADRRAGGSARNTCRRCAAHRGLGAMAPGSARFGIGVPKCCCAPPGPAGRPTSRKLPGASWSHWKKKIGLEARHRNLRGCAELAWYRAILFCFCTTTDDGPENAPAWAAQHPGWGFCFPKNAGQTFFQKS